MLPGRRFLFSTTTIAHSSRNSVMTHEPLSNGARQATIAAIRVSLEHLGPATAPEQIARYLRRFDLAVTPADVEAVKAAQFLSQSGNDAASGVDPDAAPDDAWRESEATTPPTLHEAQQLLTATGSLELAKHNLDIANGQADASQHQRERTAKLPPDDVPPTRKQA
jgi:hypothetical protein